MNSDSVYEFVKKAVSDGIEAESLWIVLIVLLASAVGAYLGAYLRRKGENLATKEDIAEITKRVEEVKAHYAEKMENLSHQNRQIIEQGSQKHQLRMAALEKRLEVHQEAYSLWWKMLSAVRDSQENKHKVVRECNTWWENNCLYLDGESRKAFKEAYMAVSIHENLHGSDPEIVQENWDKINLLGKTLVGGVDLPSIGDLETKQIPIDDSAGESKMNCDLPPENGGKS